MISTWKDCLLGDLLTLQRGFDLPARKREEGSVPIISSSGITGFHDEAKVEAPGVVTGRYGTLGEVFYIEQDFFPLNTTLYVRDFKGSNPRFISYLLQTLNLKPQNVAAAVPGLNRNDLHLLSVRKPPIATQRKIADILSGYDRLIENNTRRIKILEEMAQLLYREWFINFRFPGYEQVSMVESELGLIPQGWKVRKVKDVVLRLRVGKTYKEEELNKTGLVPVIDQSRKSFLGFHSNQPDHTASPEKPIIIFGDHTCKAELVVEAFSLSPNVIPFIAKEDLPIAYLYFLVNSLVETQEYKRHWTDLNNKSVVVGSVRLAREFSLFSRDIFAQIYALQRKNLNLKHTRDLLLPKLISGEIDVETIATSDLKALEERLVA